MATQWMRPGGKSPLQLLEQSRACDRKRRYFQAVISRTALNHLVKWVQRRNSWPLRGANCQHLLPAAQPMFRDVQQRDFLKWFVGR